MSPAIELILAQLKKLWICLVFFCLQKLKIAFFKYNSVVFPYFDDRAKKQFSFFSRDIAQNKWLTFPF